MVHVVRQRLSLVTRSLLTATTLVVCATSTFAQDRIVMIGRSELVIANGAPDRLGAVQKRVTLSEPVPACTTCTQLTVPLAGGRFFLRPNAVEAPGFMKKLSAIDTRTGTVIAIPGLESLEIGRLVADAWRPRFFMQTIERTGPFEGITRISLVDLTTLSTSELLSTSSESVFPLAYAPGADLLFLGRSAPTQDGRIELRTLHVASGATRTVTTVNGVGRFFCTADGTRAFVSESNFSQGGPRLLAIDVASGSTLAELHQPILTALLLDDPRQRLIAGVPFGPSGAQLLGALDFQFNLLGTTVVPPVLGQFAWAVSAKSAAVFRLVRQHDTGLAYVGAKLTFIDGVTGTVRPTVDVFRSWGPDMGDAAWFVQSPPAQPLLTAHVSGRDVDLTWSNPGDTYHFDIEIGTAPGQRNLAVLSSGSTSFAAANVPPGVYYVRIRAINEMGRSFPSNEVRIAVP